MGVESKPDPLAAKAARLVNAAIEAKGNGASVPTLHGRVRNFEDVLGETIYNSYLADAMTEVDADNWVNADRIAREKAIGKTTITLRNQQEEQR